MDDSIESAATGGKVSRRWLLRSTANLTAGLVAVGTVNAGRRGNERRGDRLSRRITIR